GHLLGVLEPWLPDVANAHEFDVILLLLARKEIRAGQPCESHAGSDEGDIDAIVRVQHAALDRVYRRDLLFVLGGKRGSRRKGAGGLSQEFTAIGWRHVLLDYTKNGFADSGASNRTFRDESASAMTSQTLKLPPVTSIAGFLVELEILPIMPVEKV